MMKNVLSKGKVFAEKHKDQIIIIGYTGAGLLALAAAFRFGEDYALACTSRGLEKCVDRGLIEFHIPDGDGFKVVDMKEATQYLTDHMNELKK